MVKQCRGCLHNRVCSNELGCILRGKIRPAEIRGKQHELQPISASETNELQLQQAATPKV